MNSISAHDRYALSFTSGALLTREAVIAAPLYLEARDWGIVRERLRTENLLQARTSSSGFRLAREVAQRLAALTDDELELLRDTSPSERGHLMWVAACRHYALIGDFAEEVVRSGSSCSRQRWATGTSTASYMGRRSGTELAEVKDSTLPEAPIDGVPNADGSGLLANGEIVHATLSERVRRRSKPRHRATFGSSDRDSKEGAL